MNRDTILQILKKTHYDSMATETLSDIAARIDQGLSDKPESFLAEQALSLAKARIKHGDRNMAGYHEGYAIILEELDEVWDLVKQQNPSKTALRKELLHVAAMCQRFAEDLLDNG